MRKVVRMVIYAGFALCILRFWFFVIIEYVGFGISPDCIPRPNSLCARPPSAVRDWIGVTSVFGCIPLSMLAFVCLRRAVLKLMGEPVS